MDDLEFIFRASNLYIIKNALLISLVLWQGSSEEQNVGLWLVQHVVDPPQALLHAKVPPLSLRHEVGLGDQLGEVLGEHDVPVLVLLVSVLITVVNVLVRHDYDLSEREHYIIL